MKTGTAIVLVVAAVAAAAALSQCEKMDDVQSPDVVPTTTTSIALGEYPRYPQCVVYPCFRHPLPRKHTTADTSTLPRR